MPSAGPEYAGLAEEARALLADALFNAGLGRGPGRLANDPLLGHIRS
jgi:hypothetical protein